jgi:butyrate kinase
LTSNPTTTKGPSQYPSQFTAIEKDLQHTVNEFEKWNKIIRKPLRLEEMLNPIEEQEMQVTIPV